MWQNLSLSDRFLCIRSRSWFPLWIIGRTLKLRPSHVAVFSCAKSAVLWSMFILDKIIDKRRFLITLKKGQNAVVHNKPVILLPKINEKKSHFLTFPLFHIITSFWCYEILSKTLWSGPPSSCCMPKSFFWLPHPLEDISFTKSCIASFLTSTKAKCGKTLLLFRHAI